MYWESTSTPVCGARARISTAARRPSSVLVGGIRMSTTATSGRWAKTLRSRSSASPACATTSKPESRSRRTIPSLKSTESSATTTRMALKLRLDWPSEKIQSPRLPLGQSGPAYAGGDGPPPRAEGGLPAARPARAPVARRHPLGAASRRLPAAAQPRSRSRARSVSWSRGGCLLPAGLRGLPRGQAGLRHAGGRVRGHPPGLDRARPHGGRRRCTTCAAAYPTCRAFPAANGRRPRPTPSASCPTGGSPMAAREDSHACA